MARSVLILNCFWYLTYATMCQNLFSNHEVIIENCLYERRTSEWVDGGASLLLYLKKR